MISHPLAGDGTALTENVGAHTEFNFSHKKSWQKITGTKPWNYPRYCPLCSANEILQKTLWKRRTWWLTLQNPFCTGRHSYTQKYGMTGRAARSTMRRQARAHTLPLPRACRHAVLLQTRCPPPAAFGPQRRLPLRHLSVVPVSHALDWLPGQIRIKTSEIRTRPHLSLLQPGENWNKALMKLLWS